MIITLAGIFLIALGLQIMLNMENMANVAVNCDSGTEFLATVLVVLLPAPLLITLGYWLLTIPE